MGNRIESPSSINTFRQCPRKYYYHYIEKLETKKNIHQLRGGIVHKVLEEFFNLNEVPDQGYSLRFQLELLTLLKKHWNANILLMTQLVEDHEREFYLHESQIMLVNWASLFTKKIEKEIKKGYSPKQAFSNLTPTSEQEIISQKYKVRGFIDAIENYDEGIRIMDYKTSKYTRISEAYKLQLAIYALLFEEKHGERPAKVGIYFLNESEKLLDVNEDLIKLAKKEIAQIHSSTKSDDKKDYPMKPSRLCKWSTGQCDFYEQCFGNKIEKKDKNLTISGIKK